MSDHEIDELIDDIASELRRPVRLDASFDDRVMAALEEPRVIPIAPRRAGGWLTARRWVASPLGAMAIAATLVGVMVLGTRWRQAATSAAAPVAKGTDRQVMPAVPRPADTLRLVMNAPRQVSRAAQPVVFVLPDSSAKSVALVGDFNDWDSTKTPLVYREGAWTATLLLPPGIYQYQFIVDGTRWVTDPQRPTADANDFGKPNSVVSVGGIAR